MRGKRGFVAPCLADEQNAGTRRRGEYVVSDASILLERGGCQFLGSGESVAKTAFLDLEEAVKSEHFGCHFHFPFVVLKFTAAFSQACSPLQQIAFYSLQIGSSMKCFL